jgi:hypothetical protein
VANVIPGDDRRHPVLRRQRQFDWLDRSILAILRGLIKIPLFPGAVIGIEIIFIPDFDRFSQRF